jgi:hypothetical protein
MHPWITRDFTAQIPRTTYEESLYQVEIDTKLRRVCHVVLFLSLTRNFQTFHEAKRAKERLLSASIIVASHEDKTKDEGTTKASWNDPPAPERDQSPETPMMLP